MFLYLLNMNKVNMFKIGIASSMNRIKQHLGTYYRLIDLNESYIIQAKDDKTIKMLEKQLLNDYIEYEITEDKYKHLDGATELRDIKILKYVLEDIKYKINRFAVKDMTINKGIIIPKPTPKKSIKMPVKRKDKVKKQSPCVECSHELNMQQINKAINYFQTYKDYIISIKRTSNNIIKEIHLNFPNKSGYMPLYVCSIMTMKSGTNFLDYHTEHDINNNYKIHATIRVTDRLRFDDKNMNQYIQLFIDKLENVIGDI